MKNNEKLPVNKTKLSKCKKKQKYQKPVLKDIEIRYHIIN